VPGLKTLRPIRNKHLRSRRVAGYEASSGVIVEKLRPHKACYSGFTAIHFLPAYNL
jgi:hypothetical protein